MTRDLENWELENSDLENSDLETLELENSDLETSDPLKNDWNCKRSSKFQVKIKKLSGSRIS